MNIYPHQGIPSSLIAILAIMAGVSVANLYYCQPLLNMIGEDLNLSSFHVNLMPVCTQVGYALGLLLIIPMGDLYNRRTTLRCCASVLLCSLVGIALSYHIGMLLAFSFITGFFSVIPQMFIPFVALYARPEEREQKVGTILSGLLVGILSSRVLSGYIGHWLGWRAMYLIAALMIGVMSYLVIRSFPDVAPTYKGRFVDLIKSIRTLATRYPCSLRYSVRSAFAFGSFLGMWGCLAFRMKEAPYFVGSDVVGMLGLCGIAGALTASGVGKYIPRFGTDRIHYTGIALQAIAWLMLALFHHTYVGMVAGIIFIDIGMQCIQLSNQSATMSLCPEATSRMNTIYMVTYFVGGSLGTFLAGTLWSHMGWLGTVTAGFLMLGCSVLASLGLSKVK